MTITLELPPDVERALQTEAAHHGISASQLAQQLIAETLSARERVEAEQDLEDAAEARRILAETKPEDWIPWEQLKAEIGR